MRPNTSRCPSAGAGAGPSPNGRAQGLLLLAGVVVLVVVAFGVQSFARAKMPVETPLLSSLTPAAAEQLLVGDHLVAGNATYQGARGDSPRARSRSARRRPREAACLEGRASTSRSPSRPKRRLSLASCGGIVVGGVDADERAVQHDGCLRVQRRGEERRRHRAAASRG